MYNANQEEQKVLAFWDNDKTFEKSVENPPKADQLGAGKPYVFYDGPPFATGLPHYGHIVASTMKDVVPRYFTMQGYRVERVWGWDCHGLPIENIVEKELGHKSKKEIEAMGIAKFNEMCRSKVLGYVEDWKKTIHRLGRWADMDNAYRTMDLSYMESVWWVFKQLWDKNLVYEDYRSMHICPRCETTLSQQEVSEGYKDVKDISVYVKFKLKDTGKLGLKDDSYLIAWTTTPWTLPANVAIAVGKEIDYVVVKHEGKNYIVAKERAAEVFKGKEYSVEKELKGADLLGLEYEPLFDYYSKDTNLKNHANGWKVYHADFVTSDSGTGIAHEAPAFGADDWELSKQVGLPFVQHVSLDGRMKPEVAAFAGMEVKPRSDDDKVRLGTDIAVLKYLQDHDYFFAKENVVHSYPHCWRCDTPLLNYATSSWFVKVTGIKDEALKLAKDINWSPEHIKEGRFGKWLEGARDWSISRQRFWASVMPIWYCDMCKETLVFGSVADLEKASGQEVTDLHKHIVDLITFPCKCGGTMKRVPDVLDTWFDSGSMPYAQVHYPFENKAKFEGSFPAEFIAEGQDQTRAWFYYLHVLATALFKKTAFKNVIVNGIVLAEDGKKMSKKLQNYPDPNLILEKYGADALRFYLMSSPVVAAESLNFSEAGVREVYGKVVNTLSNVLEFYQMFAPVIASEAKQSHRSKEESKNVLDQWIVAKLNELTKEVTDNLNAYRLATAARPIQEFITELSQWYVRRSRDRFKGDNEHDKQAALATLKYVLETLAKLMAPFTPFIAEKVWLEVSGKKTSVHLEMWPVVKEMKDHALLEHMATARTIVELGLALRAETKLKVRQPLAELTMNNEHLSHELLAIIADELNVKKVMFTEAGGSAWPTKSEGKVTVWLNPEITPELKAEGLVRDIVRTINQMRKDMKLTIGDRVTIRYATSDNELKQAFVNNAGEIAESVLATTVEEGGGGAAQQIDGKTVELEVIKV